MPIRPRITSEGARDLREFDRRMKRGPRPPAPPKPTKAERHAFVKALHDVPVGQTFDRKFFSKNVDEFYSTSRFQVWGFELCVLPLYSHEPGDQIRVTGAFVMRTTINDEGKKLRCRLTDGQHTWYGQVLRWISETEY